MSLQVLCQLLMSLLVALARSASTVWAASRSDWHVSEHALMSVPSVMATVSQLTCGRSRSSGAKPPRGLEVLEDLPTDL